MMSYLSYFKLRFITNLQYRMEAVAGICTQLFFALVYIMIYLAYYESGGNPPLEWQELVNYLWLQQAFFALIYPFDRETELLNTIKNGNLAYELVRPQDFYFKWYIKMLSKRLVTILLRFMPLLILATLLPYPFHLSSPYSVGNLIIFIIALILGLFLVTSLNLLMHILTMFTLDEKGIPSTAEGRFNIATIDNGVIHGISEGTCTVTATYGTASATCTVQVTKPSTSGGGESGGSGEEIETPPESSIIEVTAVKLDKTLHSLKKGESITLVATVLPINASNRNIVWTSSDTNVATVNNGLVEAKNIGEAQIRATSNNGLYSICTIYVQKDEIVISADNEEIINNTLDLNVGDSTTIAVQDTSGENINVTYESINPDIVEIDTNGKITVKSDGVAHIKITDEDGSVTIITINATTKSNANSLTKTQRIIIISVCITIAVVSLSIGIFILVRHNKKIM